MANFKTRSLHKLIVIAALTLGFLAVGCGDEDSDGSTESNATASNTTASNTTASNTTASNTTSGEGTCPGSESGGVCTLTGEITDSFTMGPNLIYLLEGGVFIGDGSAETILTIQAGTEIFGQTSGSPSFLVIQQGSKIMANGTASAPIVFSSANDPGTRSRGDWGGLIINGRAPINLDGGTATGEGDTGTYGGSEAGDSSGTLRYVRVEFAGQQITMEREYNSIAFQGVGSGTTIEYVQAHMGADDAFEFFGGTVNAKYLLATGAGDDNFDWVLGWQGKAQYLIAQQYADECDQGIEADNYDEGRNNDPRSSPVLSNVTLIGSPDSEFSDIGALLREGTAGQIWNSVIVGFNDVCLTVDSAESYQQGADGNLVMAGTAISCDTLFEDGEGAPSEGATEAWFNGGQDNVAVAFNKADTLIMDPFNESAPNFAPKNEATSGALSVGDTFFDDTTFRGAVDPANDWTAGWTTAVKN